ncbi:MAG: hypothetical protein AB7N65_18805 [Vicinamibacterales bacterium]
MHRRAFLTSVLTLAAVARAATAQDEPRYPNAGPGHFVKETRESGRFVVLEDKSVWEITERNRYVTAAWQEFEGISVRFADGDPPYTYELTNVDRDEGAAARWVKPER